MCSQARLLAYDLISVPRSEPYLAAIKALATVRKLDLVAIQVNIGQMLANVGQWSGRPQTPIRPNLDCLDDPE